MKKRIFSILFSLLLILPCAFCFAGCKDNNNNNNNNNGGNDSGTTPPPDNPPPAPVVTITSCDVYSGQTLVEDCTFTYNYGEEINLEELDISFKVSFSDNTSQTIEFDNEDYDYTHLYKGEEIETQTPPTTEWFVGTHEYKSTIEIEDFDSFEKSFYIVVNAIDRTGTFEFGATLNEEPTLTWQYDDIISPSNDPVFTVTENNEVSAEPTNIEFITEAQKTAYDALSTDAEKVAYLKENARVYGGTYGIQAGKYYFYVHALESLQYNEKYYDMVEYTVTKKVLDLPSISATATYQFTFDKITPSSTYVLLGDIIDEIVINQPNYIDGTIQINDSLTKQITHSTTPISIVAKFVQNNDNYTFENDGAITLSLTTKQALIKIPTPNIPTSFVYSGEPYGFNTEFLADEFRDWFDETTIEFVNLPAFEQHTDVGDYQEVFTIKNNNPNVAFTRQGTAAYSTTFTVEWSITKQIQLIQLINFESVVYPDANGIVKLPQTEGIPHSYAENAIVYSIVPKSGSAYGTGEILNNEELKVTACGLFNIEIFSSGNDNYADFSLIITINAKRFEPTTADVQTQQTVSLGDTLANLTLPTAGNELGTWAWSLNGTDIITSYEFASSTTIYAVYTPTNTTYAKAKTIAVSIVVE